MSTGMPEHFMRIAEEYRTLRETDSPPITVIQSHLPQKPLLGADIGCGTGRYSELVLSVLEQDSTLHCVDANEEMLAELKRRIMSTHGKTVSPIISPAEELPFEPEKLDFITTFNAVHHFDLDRFLKEVRRVVKPQGQAFVYTRTQEQNQRGIWGTHFPGFNEKENRLFSRKSIEEAIRRSLGLAIKSVVEFVFQRRKKLNELIEKAKKHHYSTFALYDDTELTTAIDTFKRNILKQYENPEDITYDDENTLFIVQA
ncbi:class I SAM-dependent methyltransferase [Candidatus Peregrinibacteria bacterium]|nr:class I SAM-dependent methyltransferase [Candidatus Peregrinibacteria bacterium]